MSTHDVPGANPRNADKLDMGCWAEADGGQSLLHVVGHEAGSVVFDIYDLQQDPALFYRDAMMEAEFKEFFSAPPTGKSDVSWTWHDKTTFPWDRVMKRLKATVPIHADVKDTLTVAQKIAQKLGLRAQKLAEGDVTSKMDQQRRAGHEVIEPIAQALERVADALRH